MVDVAIVTRAQWGARPAKHVNGIATPTPRLWLHHFATEAWHGAKGMRACQAFHMDSRGWSDIAYSFCVDNHTGTIYEGRGAGIAGGHTRGDNTTSHAISIMGNTDRHPLSKDAVRSIAKLAAHGQQRGWWGDWTGGHQQAPEANTACPGRYAMAALTDIQALTRHYLNPTHEDDDTMHGAEIIASYAEAYGPLTKQQGKDARAWIHEVYAKPAHERDGAVAYIRNLLGLS